MAFKKGNPGCPCCCEITLLLTIQQGCCGTLPPVSVVVKNESGDTVATSTPAVWPGPAGVYSVTYTFGSPNNFSVTIDYDLVCGVNNITERFLLHVCPTLQKTCCTNNDIGGGVHLVACNPCCLDPGDTDAIDWSCDGNMVITDGCLVRFDITEYLPPGTGVTLTVTYLGLEQSCTIPWECTPCTLCFETCFIVKVRGCNNLPLAGATLTGPNGEIGTTDSNGIASVTYTTGYACGDTERPVLTVGKTRFTTQNVTVCDGNWITLTPVSGYKCVICCADPIATELTLTVSSTSGAAATTGFTLDWDATDPSWIGCGVVNGIAVPAASAFCILPVDPTTYDVAFMFKFNSDCSLSVKAKLTCDFVGTCRNKESDCTGADYTGIFDFIASGGNGTLSIDCPGVFTWDWEKTSVSHATCGIFEPFWGTVTFLVSE